ncbi:hypothetical protein [Nocardioides caricicola]|uniref:Ig-like domain-containing protein n=1 Tax=Nocardioides caricicola TaxID=634770 RepID=A0ABW0N1K1_9ACTN
MTDYPPPIFAYDVTPCVVPYSSDSKNPQVVTLMVTVNNPTARHVDCTQLVFNIQPGDGGGQLTTNPSVVGCGPGLGVPWTIESDQQGNFTAVPAPPATGLDTGDSVAFILTGIEVNEFPGLVEIQAWEQTDILRLGTIGISKVKPGLAITEFSAAPVQVTAGQTSTLSWTTTGASSCTLSWNGISKPNLKPQGSYPVTPNTTTTYTLTAVGDGTTRSEQITVYVPQVTILSFGASPGQVPQGGTSALSWLVNNADTVGITPGTYGKLDPAQGTQAVSTTVDDPNHPVVDYLMTATGFGRTVSMPAPVTVMQVDVQSFTATPSQVPPGGLLPVTLTWATTWATACSISPGVGTVPTSGSAQATPGQTTTYTLQPVGLAPPTPTVTVNACPAFVSVEVITDPQNAQAFVVWQVIGGTVTMALGSGAPTAVPSSGSTSQAFPFPSAITFTATGVGMTSAVVLTLPSELGGGTVDSLKATCGYGVNAPGATATLTWQTEGGTVDGTVTAGTTQTISGESGTLTVPLGQGSAGRLWNVDFGFGSQPGHRIGIATAIPTTAQ